MKRKLGISFLLAGLVASGVYGYEWYTEPPVIHANAYEVEHGETFNINEELDVSEDVVSKTIIEGELDTHKLGEQSLTVKIENHRTITTTAEININVVDKEAPVIHAENEYRVEALTDFDLLKIVKATDNADGDMTSELEVTPYDTSVPQEQEVTLTSTDSSNNQAVKKVLLVVQDTNKPEITVKNRTIKVGGQFNILDGVSAKDQLDGDISGDIQAEGKVDPNKPGKYEVVYKVQDKSGNEAAAKSIVIVQAMPAPPPVERPTAASTGKTQDTASLTRTQKAAPAYQPMSLYFNGKRVSYANGGKSSGQSIIDNNYKASTWGGAAVFSGTDGLNTHFIGHNPGVFAGIWNAKSFIITDKSGTPFTYKVTRVYRVNDSAIGVDNGVNYWDRITGVGGGERVVFQACQNDDINYIVEAVLSR